MDGAHKQWLLGPVFMPTELCLLPCCDGAWNKGGGRVIVNREA